MLSLFLPGEQLEASPPIVAHKIMSLIEARAANKVSIFDITDGFKKEKWFSYNNIVLGLIFLYATGLIEFDEPYVVKNVKY
jgi:hypothetical protein